MNFNSLLYYKNIYDLCDAYDRKIAEMDYSASDPDVRNAIADKTLYLFCQATHTYCPLQKSFNESTLPGPAKQELQDCLDCLKSKCTYLLDKMEELHSSMPTKFDPTQEFIDLGKFLYRNDRTIDLRDMLQKAEDQHRTTMTDVRGYKNAIVNGVLMSQYSMIDVSAATHKLAKSRILVEHCLAPAAQLSNDQGLQRTGEAIYRKIEDRENGREVHSLLTPQGMMCSLYSHDLTVKDQKKVMDGATVEAVLSKKQDPAQKEDYPHIFSLLTTDHTGLIYTQNQDRFGAMQIGKWFNRDDLKIAHLLTFKSQNRWDGVQQVKNNNFLNAVKSTIDLWKNIKNEIKENQEKYYKTHQMGKVTKVMDSMTTAKKVLNGDFDQSAVENVATFLTDFKGSKLTLRAENRWHIIQSSTHIDYLAGIHQDNYVKAAKSRFRRNVTVNAIDGRKLDDQEWSNAKKFMSKAIASATKSLNFIQDAIMSKSLQPKSSLGMVSMIIENTVPFDNFASRDINESIAQTVDYSNKVLKIAEANERWLETGDQQYKDAMTAIGKTFTANEAKKFMEGVKDLDQLRDKVHSLNQRPIDRCSGPSHSGR
jgi:hypothetical protein